MNVLTIAKENEQFEETHGVSQNNQGLGLQPAFLNKETGEVEPSRFRNGQPATMHLISWLPKKWAVAFDKDGSILELNPNVIAGFSRDGIFLTRVEAAEL